jgi:hypothetical protein
MSWKGNLQSVNLLLSDIAQDQRRTVRRQAAPNPKISGTANVFETHHVLQTSSLDIKAHYGRFGAKHVSKYRYRLSDVHAG